MDEQYTLFGSHFQQVFLFNLKQTPAFRGGEISGSSTLVELNGFGVVLCYHKVHAATTGLHCGLQEEEKNETTTNKTQSSTEVKIKLL